MCGLPEGAVPFMNAESGRSDFPIIVAGKNFGCGSSREHAVIALGAAGVKAVLAQSYARIFFRNCVATGELLPVACAQPLYRQWQTGDRIVIDTVRQTVTLLATGETVRTDPIGELASIVDAGGLFAFARASGRIAHAG